MTTAMLFAAGLGTRLKPFTNKHPKALAIVNGKTILERNIQYLITYGIEEVVINIHHFGDQILDFLENKKFNCNLIISDEREEILETGGGLLKAQNLLGKEPFIVMNVDILTDLNLQDLIKFHQQNKPSVSLAVSQRESSRKLFFTDNNRLVGWKNTQTDETVFTKLYSEQNTHPLAFSGIHIMEPQFLFKIKQKGKFSIINTYLGLMGEEEILGYKHSAHLIDVGKPESILEAEKYYN